MAGKVTLVLPLQQLPLTAAVSGTITAVHARPAAAAPCWLLLCAHAADRQLTAQAAHYRQLTAQAAAQLAPVTPGGRHICGEPGLRVAEALAADAGAVGDEVVTPVGAKRTLAHALHSSSGTAVRSVSKASLTIM